MFLDFISVSEKLRKFSNNEININIFTSQFVYLNFKPGSLDVLPMSGREIRLTNNSLCQLFTTTRVESAARGENCGNSQIFIQCFVRLTTIGKSSFQRLKLILGGGLGARAERPRGGRGGRQDWRAGRGERGGEAGRGSGSVSTSS